MTDKFILDNDFEDVISVLGITVSVDGNYIICNNQLNTELFPSFVEYAKLHKYEIIEYISRKENYYRNLRLYH